MSVKTRKKKSPDRACSYKELSDESVVLRAQEGDEYALEHLLRRYKMFVRSKTRQYFIAGADDDDLQQEGTIGLYKAVRDFDSGKGSFKSFAELCITRQVITAIKAATRQKHTPLNHSVSINKPVYDEDTDRTMLELIGMDKNLDPAEIFLKHEMSADVQRRMGENMSPLETQVLELYMEGRSYQDIAFRLGKRVKSIDNSLQRIKRKLQVNLGLTDRA